MREEWEAGVDYDPAVHVPVWEVRKFVLLRMHRDSTVEVIVVEVDAVEDFVWEGPL